MMNALVALRVERIRQYEPPQPAAIPVIGRSVVPIRTGSHAVLHLDRIGARVQIADEHAEVGRVSAGIDALCSRLHHVVERHSSRNEVSIRIDIGRHLVANDDLSVL